MKTFDNVTKLDLITINSSKVINVLIQNCIICIVKYIAPKLVSIIIQQIVVVNF